MVSILMDSLLLLAYCFLVIAINPKGGIIGVVSGAGDFCRSDFPADMVFGAATSAYQAEGAALEDGKTPSIWDTFTNSSGIYRKANADLACDGYHKYKEDIRLMADMGLEAYRFSISWPRLIPDGRGSINSKGLQYYNNLINELLHHGIKPHVTLYHYDLPQVLEDEYDGWLSKRSIEDYTAYADVCFREFGDRVLHWTTFNEPNIVALGGYDIGISAPGRCSYPFGFINCTSGNSSTEPYIVAHHLLLAHASAARLYQSTYKDTQHGCIGMNVYASWYEPYTDAEEDAIASQRATDFLLGWFVNPLAFGDYPDVVKKNVGKRLPSFSKLERKKIKGSYDFLGINHYNTIQVKDNPSSLEMDIRDLYADMAATTMLDETLFHEFPVNPRGMQKLLEYLKHKYGNLPVYIHENGQPSPHYGSLNDTSRVEYLHGYMGGLLDAIRNGSNIKGYFVWSFIDVFEFFGAYNTSYGLYYVDYNDKILRRYPKLSAHWYSNFLKGGHVYEEDVIVKKAEGKKYTSF